MKWGNQSRLPTGERGRGGNHTWVPHHLGLHHKGDYEHLHPTAASANYPTIHYAGSPGEICQAHLVDVQGNPNHRLTYTQVGWASP